MDDPYFTIEFYSLENKQSITVKLDSVNKIPVLLLNQSLQRKASTFKLPLSPSEDISNYVLVFTEIATAIPDSVQHKKQIHVSYHRQDVESNGTIRVKASQFRVLYHDFDSISPNSFDQIKFSNELKLALYL
jgi:hypothetical protein